MKDYNKLNIQNEDDFQKFMETLDDNLKKDEIPIPNRPLVAWDRVSSRLTFGLPFPDSRKVPSPNSYSGEDLSTRMILWFKGRYGNLLIEDTFWRIPILIKDDIYPARVNKQRYGFKPLHILIDGLTEEYSNSINDEDKSKIVRLVEFNYEARKNISQKDSILLIRQAIGDIDASVSHLLAQSPQYGLAKWASLQASEKVLKAFIENKGSKFPTGGKDGHDLIKLAELAENLGLNEIHRKLLNSVQCSAGVRYGNPSVFKIEALIAHHNSLSVCSIVTQQM